MPKKEKKLTTAEQVAALKGSFNKHVKIETPQWQEINTTVGRLEKKIDRIVDIKINGAQGIENVLVHMWEATAGARWRIRARRAAAKWTEAHPTIKSIAVWALKKLIALALAVVVVWVMYKLGLGQFIEHVLRISPQ